MVVNELSSLGASLWIPPPPLLQSNILKAKGQIKLHINRIVGAPSLVYTLPMSEVDTHRPLM